MFPDAAVLLFLVCDLGQPDDGLDGFDLTEEGPHALERMVTPVVQEASRDRRHTPGGGIRVSPVGNMGPDLVYDRSRIVLLLVGGQPVIAMQIETRLALVGIPAFALAGAGDRRN